MLVRINHSYQGVEMPVTDAKFEFNTITLQFEMAITLTQGNIYAHIQTDTQTEFVSSMCRGSVVVSTVTHYTHKRDCLVDECKQI